MVLVFDAIYWCIWTDCNESAHSYTYYGFVVVTPEFLELAVLCDAVVLLMQILFDFAAIFLCDEFSFDYFCKCAHNVIWSKDVFFFLSFFAI